jgi:hypothetical protein
MLVPGVLLLLMRDAVTPLGLYIAAAVRIAIGVVLIGAASVARTPTAMRVLGVIVVALGVMTPLFGADRARTLLDAWQLHGQLVLRLLATVGTLLGVFVMYAVTDGRRVPSRPTRSAP